MPPTLATGIPGKTAATPVAAPMAGGTPPNHTPQPAAHATADSRAKQFGGNPTGRARADGHQPGSPEAIAADRERERVKKAKQRARERAENPPVLPARPVAPAGAPAASGVAPQTGAESGGALAPLAPLEEIIAWQSQDFTEIVGELLPAIEQGRVKKRTAKAAAAKLPPDLLKEVEKDSRWDETTKKSLGIVLPALGAKYMNLTGISAAWKYETILAVCLLRLYRKESSLDARLDQIIAQNRALLEKNNAPAPKTGP